jgi:hypothetical protein
MKARIFNSLFLMLLPALVAAQNTPPFSQSADAQVLWEFDTGG